jgi:HAE1 family hydrophobic/amphiphilic exporter-1
VKDALKRIHGMADVIIFGERNYSVRLWLDPSQLGARGLTASDVVAALARRNVQIAAGQVGQSPAPKDQMFLISVWLAGAMGAWPFVIGWNSATSGGHSQSRLGNRFGPYRSWRSTVVWSTRPVHVANRV